MIAYEILKKLFSNLGFKSSNNASIRYSQWIDKVEPHLIKTDCNILKENTSLLSIILITSSDLDNDLVRNSITSIINQTALNWELFVVTDKVYLGNSTFTSKQIKIISIEEDLNFFESINSVFKKSSGKFITFINEGDRLSKHLIMQFNNCIASSPSAQIIITDEDLLDTSGQRSKPFFKPDWNPDYLANYNYFSRAVIYKRKLFNDSECFSCKEKNPYHALALQATQRLDKREICHIDKVLFHFQQATLDNFGRIKFKIPQPRPLVTVIIPSKDKLELLKSCLDGVLNNTAYKNLEVIIVDNQSEHSVTQAYLSKIKKNPKINLLHYNKSFNFSDMNNLAVNKAKGEIICFLNNDISIMKDDWLTEMVSHACRSEVGCVGAKLFYPNGSIQHAGVILGLKGYASHAHKGFSGDSEGYFKRLIVSHNVSAVTAACMVVKKDIFNMVGGFDAKNLGIAYNDVDLCLKIRNAGYRNLFTPHAKLIHHESESRGKKRNKEQQKQLKKESRYLVQKWGNTLYSDPAYNKNLTLLREDFSLGMDRLNEY